MAERARRLGVRLRPHVKTHKCAALARLQCGGEPGPIAVSTLREARAFAEEGFRDQILALPIAPSRIEQALGLVREGIDLALVADTDALVGAIAGAAGRAALRVRLFLEVDVGDGRSGLADPADLAALARRVAADPALRFAGLLAHRGRSYEARSREELRAHAEAERDRALAARRAVEDAGVEVPCVSVGSTPTACAASDLAGIDEIRPGNYLLFDLHQAAIGSCGIDDVAIGVLAEVTSVHPREERAVIDAGALALSKDPGPRHVDGPPSFGLVVDPEDRSPLPGLRLHRLSQEHGHLVGPGVVRLEVGRRVLVLPNHACLVCAAHDVLHLVEGESVVESVPVARGW